jgi:hypothetical protein
MVWQEVIENRNVWLYEYVANGYQVNASALPLNENDWAIVSPPVGMSGADFAAIDAKGKVAALIAPSSAHDLGQAEWQARYPNAIPYPLTTALSQLKQVERPFMPLSKLSAPNWNFEKFPVRKKAE